jgi:hypothetical protein
VKKVLRYRSLNAKPSCCKSKVDGLFYPFPSAAYTTALKAAFGVSGFFLVAQSMFLLVIPTVDRTVPQAAEEGFIKRVLFVSLFFFSLFFG